MAEKKYDLVVIGAGTAGCLAAYTAAKKGLTNIAIIDRKKRALIGKKICGDGIGTKHLDFLKKVGFDLSEEIIAHIPQNAHLISPDKEKDYTLPIKGQLAIINRHQFGQELLENVINQGVKLLANTMFTGIEKKEDKMIIALSSAKEKHTINSSLVIDASGFNSRIRTNTNLFDHYAKVRDDEQYYCYREICSIENLPKEFKEEIIFEFSYQITKGGYMWYFSRGGKELNMGTGIPKTWMNITSPKKIFSEAMETRFTGITTLDSGGGFVPTRHPIPTHVNDNIILTGDAGVIVNPLHGGGLGASLASGYFAGKIAAEKVPKEDLTEQDLWEFNKLILERYGHRYSILDLYRILLQNIPDKELNNAFKNDYLPLGKIFYAREYDQLLLLSRKLGEIWQELPNQRLNILPKFIEQVHAITHQYPEQPAELQSWAATYQTIYDTYQKAIAIKK
jgi:geranylgeranyl reductase family protein